MGDIFHHTPAVQKWGEHVNAISQKKGVVSKGFREVSPVGNLRGREGRVPNRCYPRKRGGNPEGSQLPRFSKGGGNLG